MSSSELASIAASNGAAAIFAVVKHAAYPFKVDGNISALESAVSELEAMVKDVLIIKERSYWNQGFPVSTVQDWLGKVNKVIEEAKDITQKYKQRHRIIHVISSDYKNSRDAAKKLLEVKSLSANEIINLIKDTHSAGAAAYQLSPGVGLNVNVKKYGFYVHLGKK